jgi:hypothetical protein
MLWKWKLGRDLDDVLHLLNGETRYDRPVPDARVCMAWRGDHPQFWVFARKAAKIREPHDGLGGWNWKLATDADDVLRFLSGDGPYGGPVAEAQIAAAWAGDHHRFYVFFRSVVPGYDLEPGNWNWRLTTDSSDVVAFLNGAGASPNAVTTARIATAHRDHHDEFFIFYRCEVAPTLAGDDSAEAWRWHAAGSPDDVRKVVEGKGRPPMDFQVAAPPVGYGVFQVFTTPAGRGAERARAMEERVGSN